MAGNRRGMAAAVIAFALFSASCTGLSAYKYRQFYSMVSPVKNADGVYEDRAVSFQFDFTEKKINVLVHNNGKDSIEVEWPKARFIDPEGTKHEVANNQTLISKDQSKIAPTVILAGMTEKNVIVPADNQEQVEQWTWYIKPLFNQVDDGALLNRRKTFGVLLPIKVGEEERVYSFEFMVTAIVPYRGQTPG